MRKFALIVFSQLLFLSGFSQMFKYEPEQNPALAKNKVKTITFNAHFCDDRITMRNISEIDREGIVQRLLVDDGEGDIMSDITFKYDASRQLVQKVHNRDKYVFDYTYGDSGKKTRIDIRGDDGSFKGHLEYVYNGNEVIEISFLKNGQEEGRHTSVVDEHDNFVKTPNGEFEYTYDSSGNILSMITTKPGESYSEKLEITYENGLPKTMLRTTNGRCSLKGEFTYEYYE